MTPPSAAPASGSPHGQVRRGSDRRSRRGRRRSRRSRGRRAACPVSAGGLGCAAGGAVGSGPVVGGGRQGGVAAVAPQPPFELGDPLAQNGVGLDQTSVGVSQRRDQRDELFAPEIVGRWHNPILAETPASAAYRRACPRPLPRHAALRPKVTARTRTDNLNLTNNLVRSSILLNMRIGRPWQVLLRASRRLDDAFGEKVPYPGAGRAQDSGEAFVQGSTQAQTDPTGATEASAVLAAVVAWIRGSKDRS